MKYKIFISVAILFMFPIGTYFVYGSDISFDAKAAILFEPTTKEILLEQNPHEKLSPASVTKIMTMLLIYDAISSGKISWDDNVTISSHAANMGGSQIFLEEGQTQTVRDLTKSVVIASANDAAVALAEHISGTEEGFVNLMNERAKVLGMENTNFVNSCGLDAAGHLTTAYDIALMSGELITKYPEITETALVWMDTITHDTKRGKEEFGLTNTNKLIRSYTGITGLKTGSTSQALFCVSATAKRDELQLVAVILGSPNSKVRFNEARRLLDYGYANFALLKGDTENTHAGTIKVHKGKEDQTDLLVKSQVNVIVKKGELTTLDKEIETLDFVNAPITKGTKAGEIIYKSDGLEVGRADLVISKDIEKAGIGNMFKKILTEWAA